MPKKIPMTVWIASTISAIATAETYQDIQAIFSNNCLPCHQTGGGANFGNLKLTDSESYDMLVNVDPENSDAAGNDLKRVDPASLENSLLWQKVNHEAQDKGYGSNMPFGGPQLGEEDLALIQAWIEAGAPETESFSVGTGVLDPVRPVAKAWSTVRHARDIEISVPLKKKMGEAAARTAKLTLYTPQGREMASIESRASSNSVRFQWRDSRELPKGTLLLGVVEMGSEVHQSLIRLP